MAWKIYLYGGWENRLVQIYAGIRSASGNPTYVIIIPWHWDLSGILGMAALCVIVGGVFGCVIAAWLGIRAVWYMVGFPISKIVAIHKRTC